MDEPDDGKIMMDMMQAVAIRGGKGGADALYVAQVPRPTPKAGEILIRIHGAGLNRTDIGQREGRPPPAGAPDIMGVEAAGVVVEATGRWRVGDRVCALLNGGGYAEYVACDARFALPIPDEVDFVQAAGLPEAVFTVWANVFESGALRSGETFMIHGATSGIGVTAIQMAKAAGARVIATSRGPEKAAAAKAMGADIAIDSTAEDFVEVAKSHGGVDVILCMVGAPYFNRNIEALRFKGRLIFVSMQGGSQGEIDLRPISAKQAIVSGSTLRTRPTEEKARLAAAVENHAWRWVRSGLVRPPIDQVFPLADASQAHARMESLRHIGKLILAA
jgi:putative PIG3 family NAD(P)H quinone oxidoreductase